MKADRDLKGDRGVWGLWERMVPSLLHEEDTAGRRMLDIHLLRYRIASRWVEGKRVLDVASGSGYGCRMLRDAGALSVTGVDLSPEAVEHARATYGGPGIEFLQGNAEELSFDEPFDVVTSFETLEHLPNPKTFLARIHAQLKPDGVLLLSAPIGETRHIDVYHLHRFERDDIYDMLSEAGFKVEASTLHDWRVTNKELLHWKDIYPDSWVGLGALLLSWRGRKSLLDAVFKGYLACPMLMTQSRRVALETRPGKVVDSELGVLEEV